jgi:hypothetical protein
MHVRFFGWVSWEKKRREEEGGGRKSGCGDADKREDVGQARTS